ncbi:hypothetical protein AAMO2058_000424200 [Amorphochlora amoebiformis]
MSSRKPVKMAGGEPSSTEGETPPANKMERKKKSPKKSHTWSQPIVESDTLPPDVEAVLHNLDDMVFFKEATYLQSGRMRLQQAAEKLELLYRQISVNPNAFNIKSSPEGEPTTQEDKKGEKSRAELKLLEDVMGLVDNAQQDILANLGAKWDIYAELEEKFKTMTDEEAEALEQVLSYASVDSPRRHANVLTLPHLRQGRGRIGLNRKGKHRRASSAHNLEKALDVFKSRIAGPGARSVRVGSVSTHVKPRPSTPSPTNATRYRRGTIHSRARSNSLERKIKHHRSVSQGGHMNSARRPTHGKHGKKDSKLLEAKYKETMDAHMTSNTLAVLEHVDSWDNMNIWKLNDVSDGRPLTVLVLKLCEKEDLFARCHVNKWTMGRFITKIEDGYHDIPYHNKIHAADVVQSVHFFLQSSTFRDICQKFPLLRLSAYIAAAVHDFRHPGTNNEFQKNLASEDALTYNDISVLENMHVSQAFKLMRTSDCNIFESFTREDRSFVRKLIIKLVLATDMSKHSDSLRELNRKLQYKTSTKKKWMKSEDPKDVLSDAELLLSMAIKCSDLSNPCRPKKMMLEWSGRINQEFWKQGDLEKIHSLPVGPGHDRTNSNVPLGQQFFIKVLVSPMYLSWEKVVPEAKVCLKNLKQNLKYWLKKSKRKQRRLQKKKKKEEGKTEEGASVDSSLATVSSVTEDSRSALEPAT